MFYSVEWNKSLISNVSVRHIIIMNTSLLQLNSRKLVIVKLKSVKIEEK